MKELIVYEFDGVIFRPVPGEDGKPWFIANEVCAILGIRNVSHALRKLDDDERGWIRNDTLGGVQERAIVSESGLYMLIMRSNKPIAIKFQKWVTREVLPAIRKHGFYVDERRADDVPPEVLAAWRRAYGGEPNGGLRVMFDGDLIHEVKGTPLDTVEKMAEAIDRAYAQYGTVCQLRRGNL